MWISEHSKFYPDVSPEEIWKIWIDINKWPSWHGDLDYCKLDTHSMEEKDNGVLLFNKLVVTGPLKWLWIKLVAKHLADTVPDEMDSLGNLARKG